MIVILFDPRRPSLVPLQAIEHLVGEVQYTEEMPVAVPWSLPLARPVDTGDPESPAAPVLLSSDPDHPAVTARLAAGARLISAPETPRGERLVDAVAMMDKLRTAGPWESEQTHDSLRRFLLEETYELLDAVRSGNAEALCEELGDVLLQVLFHARIAEDAPQSAFGIDDVANTLMRKLGNRVPGVLAGQSISLEDQLAQWEERKAAEKSRNSVMDDVHTGQPALALAQKVVERVAKAGLPADLIPADITSISMSPDVDAESALRTAALEFVDAVRGVEKSIAAGRRGYGVPEEFDVVPLGVITEDEWREHWPSEQPPLELADDESEDIGDESEDDADEDADGDVDGDAEGAARDADDEPEAAG
ncbi:nucleoside triphosphate pyrophosphohydrolase [Mycobacterium rhizamassiliense]|jgi:XTP/dITP diphosphohydrolase|uniref:Nucleoside triphosphate pyrophosphohydrolase n=1 Tax=Mycobacterium rhizamassiliense TaxID=1841860 RepID=A0A2U3NUZ8_9MYCO|nr:nucleoside triphosphate pyrophosphohydrolase [Mycobacterium rhizamassiliense]SPM35312.1 nucleoside triphosphate pyrophosphohydrolase [Mycobacterium rhizamassiliense]